MAKIKRHINKSKRVSHQCRNNNQCPWCRRSRLRNSSKRIFEAGAQVKEA